MTTTATAPANLTIDGAYYYVPLDVSVRVVSMAKHGQVKVSRPNGSDILVAVTDLKAEAAKLADSIGSASSNDTCECGAVAYDWCIKCDTGVCVTCAGKRSELGLICAACAR